MLLTALTLTHNRPHLFKNLERYVSRMKRIPDQWLVINDSEDVSGYSYNFNQEVYNRTEKSLLHGLNASLLMALPYIKGTAIAILEDDDYYSPDYLYHLEAMLKAAPLAGFIQSTYWKPFAYKQLENFDHCPLAATGFTSDCLEAVKFIASWGNPYVDNLLFEGYSGKIKLVTNTKPNGSVYHCGIKLGGISPSHREDKDFVPDPGGKRLRQWIGTDAENYL